MSKKILIMKTGSTIPSLLAEGEDFEDWFIRGSGQESGLFCCCAINKGQPLPELDEVTAVIITGSAAYVTDLAPWNHAAAAYLRETHQRQLPILGVCYGHQLLAWAFGGEVGFHPAGREIGTVEVFLTKAAEFDALFSGMAGQFKAQTSHQQSVLQLPPGAVLLANNSFEPNHAFRLGASTWGVQFHPEFSAHTVATYIRERKETIAAEGLDVDQLLAQTQETPLSAALLKRFVATFETVE